MSSLRHSLLLPFLLCACTSEPQETGEPSNPAAGMGAIEEIGIRNLAVPRPNLLTAGQITPEQFERLVAVTPVRLVNLRVPGEAGTGWEAEAAARHGSSYVELPIEGAEGITEANARRLGEILAERPEGTVDLVYCGSSNRVGALLGLMAHVVEGMPAEEAYRFGVDAGATRLQPVLREELGLPAKD